MQEPPQERISLTEAEQRKIAHVVMRRQAGLSLRVAAVFAVLLFGLPLVNHFWPDVANGNIFGFTATWLFLGVLFYPITVLLSFYFVKKSDAIEAESADWRAILGREAVEDRDHPVGKGHAE